MKNVEDAESKFFVIQELSEFMSEQMQQMQRLQLAGTLAGGIAHDLNNQLTVVLGNLELAMNHLPDGEDVFDSLRLAKTAASRCADMSRRLLYLGRGARTRMARIEMARAIIEAQQMLECLKPRHVRLLVESEVGLYIHADSTLIQQLLINLGTNAFHAMEQGGDVEIRGYLEAGRVNIMVRDHGCGIPKSLRQRIFEPFFTTRGEDGGSGLGLSTVRSIIDSHGGSLGLESVAGQGSTFLVSFPALEPEAES